MTEATAGDRPDATADGQCAAISALLPPASAFAFGERDRARACELLAHGLDLAPSWLDVTFETAARLLACSGFLKEASELAAILAYLDCPEDPMNEARRILGLGKCHPN